MYVTKGYSGISESFIQTNIIRDFSEYILIFTSRYSIMYTLITLHKEHVFPLIKSILTSFPRQKRYIATQVNSSYVYDMSLKC